VVWYVLPKQVQRTRAVVQNHRADDLVDVRAWYGRSSGGEISH
jgi:hypothetical protein